MTPHFLSRWLSTAWMSLNWCWRLIMTGICFIAFALGGLMLRLVWVNILLAVRVSPERRRSLTRHGISASFRFFLNTMRTLGILDYQLAGMEKIRADRGCLIIANHPTLLDYVMLASALPDIDCLVKARLLESRFIRGVIIAADYLKNSEGQTLLATCRERLEQGDNILIFPEGTRTSPGQPLTLQRGAANVAVRCECDVRIVHIRCSQQTLGKQSRWYQIPRVKPVFTVTAGERLSSDTFLAGQNDQPALAARQLNQQLAVLLTPDHGTILDVTNARIIT